MNKEGKLAFRLKQASKHSLDMSSTPRSEVAGIECGQIKHEQLHPLITVVPHHVYLDLPLNITKMTTEHTVNFNRSSQSLNTA